MKKALVVAAAVAVVILIGGLTAAYLSLNSLVKTGVETWGPRLTKTEVRLASANLLPLSGSGSLSGLVIGNPKGYTGDAFSVRRAALSVEPKSLLSDVVVIRKIEVIAPEIFYEGTLSDGNLQQLERNLSGPEAAPKAGAPEPKGGASAPKSAAPARERKVIIDDFLLTGAKATIALTSPRLKPLVVTLPELHVTGIGRKTGGATPEQAAKEIFAQVTAAVKQSAAEAAKSSVKDQLRQALGSGGKNLGQTLNALFKKK